MYKFRVLARARGGERVETSQVFYFTIEARAGATVLLVPITEYLDGANFDQALMETGAFAAVDYNLFVSGRSDLSPPLDLMQMYDVIYVYGVAGAFGVTDLGHCPPGTETEWCLLTSNAGVYIDHQGFGDKLADYFDAGGRVVLGDFSESNWTLGGRFAESYRVTQPASPQGGGFPGMTLGAVAEPESPLMAGVSTPRAFVRQLYHPLEEGATVVASWDTGTSMVVRGSVQGRNRVDLFLWPGDDVFGHEDNIKLIRNALLY
jgi:hypothetical protein